MEDAGEVLDGEVSNTTAAPTSAPSAEVDQPQSSSGGRDSKKKSVDWKKKPVYTYNGDEEAPLTYEQKLRITFWFMLSTAATVGLLVGSWFLFYWVVARQESRD
jgi:hypothetical protein